MKKIILTIFFVLIFTSPVFSLFDFIIIQPTGGMEVTVQSVSVPFEGINFNLDNFNRLFLNFAGTIHRRFNVNGWSQDSQIVYINQTVNTIGGSFRMASCFHEATFLGFGGGLRYGFAKYLVTIRHLADGKVFRFYWNTLDSKCGTDNLFGTDYTRDWNFSHYTNPDRYVISGNSAVMDSVLLTEQYKEFKVWKLIYGRNEPIEKDFKVRTTPFPFSPYVAENVVRDVIVGTNIIFDTVYSNEGINDHYGYNTWINLSYYNYFTDPSVMSI